MINDKLRSTPHRRYNPLTGEWVLVSPHRLKRPWQGRVETLAPDFRPAHDEKCYLCPGNSRAGDAVNPSYGGTFVFNNDFAALLAGPVGENLSQDPLLHAESESGICRVVCFSPRHDLTLPELSHEEVLSVVEVWAEQYQELGARDDIGHVQIFENKGALMGCSNPHPHGQIWASGTLPLEPSKEDVNLRLYQSENNGRCMLCDYVELELRSRERIVCENDSFMVVTPFWAKWPFECLLLSRDHVHDMGEFSDAQKRDFAGILKELLVRYDNLFEISFPYSMGFHQAPTDGRETDAWHFHGHFYPPLLRSATVQKFMVGFEMLGTPQRDFPPELAADRLRSVSGEHYKKARNGAAG